MSFQELVALGGQSLYTEINYPFGGSGVFR